VASVSRPRCLVGLTVALQIGVADSLAKGLFLAAFDFLDRTGDSVLIYGWALPAYPEDIAERTGAGVEPGGFNEWRLSPKCATM
jgi:hypothetical protein